MSHTTSFQSSRFAFILLTLLFQYDGSPALAGLLDNVGAIGDSLTHEYRSWIRFGGSAQGIPNYSETMLNWTEHLELQGVSFGSPLLLGEK